MAAIAMYRIFSAGPVAGGTIFSGSVVEVIPSSAL
jgi:hypothetical protein